jgi:aspartate/methionine/tyrosine aminotransferase
MNFRDEVLNVRESPMVQIATAAESMPGSVKLCYGESDMVTPDFICRAATDALQAGHTFYTHTAGYKELREAIAEKTLELHGRPCGASEIVTTIGASAAIFTAIRTFVGAGDNAVVISPAYAIFANCVTMVGGEPRAVPLVRQGKRFMLDLARVERAIDGRTRMLIVNSPSNPTGWMATIDEQRALVQLAEAHDVMILSDEVYDRLVYDVPRVAPSFATFAQPDRVIVANSFSKTYCMTGWRLGWAQASERIVHQMYKAAEFITSNAAAMVQQAGIVALRDGEPFLRELRAHYTQRRAQVLRALASIPGVSVMEPQGAFYVFFAVEGMTDSTAFATDLLRETGLALTPGVAFGAAGEGYLRLCFAAREQTVADGLQRFSNYMARR